MGTIIILLCAIGLLFLGGAFVDKVRSKDESKRLTQAYHRGYADGVDNQVGKYLKQHVDSPYKHGRK